MPEAELFDPVTALGVRLDQSMADFRIFVKEQFGNQVELNRILRDADQRLLDERFKTQTTTLDAAFAAAEKARQEALTASNDQSTRLEARIKDLEDRVNMTAGKSAGLNAGWVYAIGALGALGTFLSLFAWTVH